MIYLLLTKTEWGNWIFISRSRTHHWTLHSLWQTSPRPARGHRVWDQVLVSHGGWSPGQRWIIFWCWKYLLSASSPVPCYPAHWITAGGDHQLTSNFYHFSHKLLMFCILLYFRIKETSKLKWKEAVRKSSSNKSIKMVVKRHKVRTFHKLLLIVLSLQVPPRPWSLVLTITRSLSRIQSGITVRTARIAHSSLSYL